MARKRRLNENKKNIIASLIEEYDIQTAADVQEALKDLLGGTIQEMMEAELDNHLGYESYERSDNPDYRNGTKPKTLRSTVGEIPIAVPKDRDGDFEPKVVPKYKKDISDIESKIISLSAKGLTTRQISSVIEDIYGCEISEGKGACVWLSTGRLNMDMLNTVLNQQHGYAAESNLTSIMIQTWLISIIGI